MTDDEPTMRRIPVPGRTALALALALTACAPAYRAAVEPERQFCRSEPVAFFVPEGTAQQRLLDRWCAAVGPPVYQMAHSAAERDVARITSGAGDAANGLPVADSVLIVAWNNHVGGGALEQLVSDLRAGRLTGGDSVHHFVLLLQEVYRSSGRVPALVPGMLFAGEIEEAPPGGARTDIVDWVRRHPELSLLYAPSMRNGAQAGVDTREDRGSAIVTSLPLREPAAYELPVQRQRRVVPAGVVAGQRSTGEPWHLHVASVHLENRPEGTRNPERARDEQVVWLLDALPDSANAVLGGDMNTWMRGPEEIAIWRTRERYPDTPPLPPGPTYVAIGVVVRMYLDYLFLRLDEGVTASPYQRLESRYESDHHPLVGWVRFGSD